MIKEFFKNSLIYFLANVSIKGINIILIPIYTRYLSPSDYGLIDMVSVLFSIINILFTFEVSQAVARFYSETNNSLVKKDIVSTGFVFTLLSFFSFFILALLFKETFLYILSIKPSDILFYLIIFNIITSGAIYYTNNILKWRVEPNKLVFISVINILLYSFISIFLLVSTTLKVEGVLIGQILSNTISTIISINLSKDDYSLAFNTSLLLQMLKFSLPLTISSLSVIALYYTDRLVINYYLGISDLGLYGVAYRFASVMSFLIYAIQNSLLPLIYKEYKNESTLREISKIFNFVFFVAVSIIIMFILFSKEIILVFTTEKYYNSHSLIPILAASIFLYNMYVFAPGIWIKNKTIYYVITTTVSLIANIALNLLLVRYFKLLGIAIATLISSFFFIVLNILISNKYYPIPYEFSKIFIISIISIVCSYFITYSIEITQISIQIIFVKILLGICLILMNVNYLVGLNNIYEFIMIRGYFRKKQF